MRPSVSAGAPLASAPGDWNRQLQQLVYAESRDRLFLAELPASARDGRAVRFALTTFLLGAGGSSSFGVAGRPEYTRPLWFRDYERALALGRPLGPARPDGNSVWHRAFQHGDVIVNPTLVARWAAPAARGPAIRLAPQTGTIVLRRPDYLRGPRGYYGSACPPASAGAKRSPKSSTRSRTRSMVSAAGSMPASTSSQASGQDTVAPGTGRTE
jgi:hypothetical protein